METDTALIIAAIVSSTPAWYGVWVAHQAKRQSKINTTILGSVVEQTNGLGREITRLSSDKARTEGIAEGKATEIKRAQEAGNV